MLPFATIGADREDEFFAHGITDDILSRVSQGDTLQVTSKTTSMQYRNTPKAVREISAELGAAYVLEGSGRSAGAKVRVVAQLIDAREDKHIWAESYDRALEDPLGAQEEIADRIALAVVEMLETRRTVPFNSRTSSMV